MRRIRWKMMAAALLIACGRESGGQAEPDLTVLKEGPGEVRLGQSIAYALTVTNKGKEAFKDVVLRDKIPAGLKFRDRTEGLTMKWDLGDLEPGQSRKVTYTVESSKAGVFENEAMVYSPKDKLQHRTALKTKVSGPDLKIVMEGPGRVFLNKPVSFKISVSNAGDVPVKDVDVTCMLPDSMDYVESAPRGVYSLKKGDDSAKVTWSSGEVEPGKAAGIEVTVRARKTGPCTLSAKLVCRSREFPALVPLEAVVNYRVMGIPAMHVSSYDTEDPVEVGQRTVYVIEARNEGTGACTNVRIRSRIPPEMEFVEANGPSESKYDVEAREILFEPVPLLAPGEKLTFKVTCKVIKEGCAKHAATLTYDQFDKPIVFEEGTTCVK